MYKLLKKITLLATTCFLATSFVGCNNSGIAKNETSNNSSKQYHVSGDNISLDTTVENVPNNVKLIEALEFTYMLMQSYDFLELFKKYGCRLEMGGNDQWSNMLGGADLIRRKERESAFACTFQLLLTHDGRKMGKTEKGALWLDPAKTSPYDFYQYWRNVDDQDVEKCLGLLTFLPMDEVRRLGALKDSQINEAKKVLAYEVTKLVHGEEEAEKAQEAAASLFGGAAMGGSIPTTEITAADLEKDARVTTLLVTCGLAASNSAARRLVQGGGVSLGEEKVTDVNAVVTAEMIPTDGLMLRSGKKKFHRVVLK